MMRDGIGCPAVTRSASHWLRIALACAVAPLALGGPVLGEGVSFVNLRFYPGEAVAEGRPSKPNPITLSFNGEVVENPKRFAPGDDKQTLSPDETFINRVVRANGAASADDILALWNPQERAAITSQMTDAEVVRRNQLLYQSVENSAFLAKVLYGPYTLLIVRHARKVGTPFSMVYPARQGEEGYLLTNDLEDDRLLEFLYFFYRDRVLESEEPGPAKAVRSATNEADTP